jgi:hypothetical protein
MNEYLVSMLTKLLNTLTPYFDPPSSGVTIIPKEWMNWKSKQLIQLLKQSGDSKKVDSLLNQKFEKKATTPTPVKSDKTDEVSANNNIKIFNKFGIGDDERLIDRKSISFNKKRFRLYSRQSQWILLYFYRICLFLKHVQF